MNKQRVRVAAAAVVTFALIGAALVLLMSKAWSVVLPLIAMKINFFLVGVAGFEWVGVLCVILALAVLHRTALTEMIPRN